MERTTIYGFLVGMGTGAATALLFAPYSGRRARARISEGAAYAKDCGETASKAVWSAIDGIVKHKQGVAEAIKRGTHAYKQAIG